MINVYYIAPPEVFFGFSQLKFKAYKKPLFTLGSIYLLHFFSSKVQWTRHANVSQINTKSSDEVTLSCIQSLQSCNWAQKLIAAPLRDSFN